MTLARNAEENEGATSATHRAGGGAIGATEMELDDIEIGRKYRCDYKGIQYFATVTTKSDKDVCVILGDIVNKDGDPGDPTEALGTLGEIQVLPSSFIPFERTRRSAANRAEFELALRRAKEIR